MTTHSKQFYERKYKELQQYTKNADIPFPYLDIREFESNWIKIQSSDSKQVFRELKRDLKRKQFYEKKYKELQQYAENAGLPFPYNSIDEFQSDWDAIQKAGSKQVFREVKYGLKYNTPYKTALAEKRMLKKLGLEDKSLEDLKKMSTQEFADKYKDEIMESYQQKHDTKIAEGATPMEARAYARRYLSEYWFGSM